MANTSQPGFTAVLSGVEIAMNTTLDNKNEKLKEELIARFRSYLDTDFAFEATTNETDLMSLFEELTGLKN